MIAQRVGQQVLVEWSGAYYPAVIVAQRDAEHVLISYNGYGEEWDEVVSLDRIVEGKHLDGSPLVDTHEPYDLREAQIGDKISVEWQGAWYDAHVEHVLSRQEIVIHYDGYGHEWDEVVGGDRVRR